MTEINYRNTIYVNLITNRLTAESPKLPYSFGKSHDDASTFGSHQEVGVHRKVYSRQQAHLRWMTEIFQQY